MKDELTNLSVIKDLLARHGFTFSKALGQNFIVNPGICPKIAKLGGAAGDVGVIEIGTGIGVLTAQLAARAQKVVAIELDTRLMPILKETLAEFDNVTILNQDVMKTDLHQVIREHFAGMRVVVCANLPYYITSPILMNLLESRLPIEAVTVMVQKEAAQRICAAPGTRQAGAISVAVHYYSQPKILFPVSRGSFLPSPDVDSCVIRLDILSKPPIAVPDEALFFRIVRGAFSQRRKTILNGVCAALGCSKDTVRAMLEEAQISPTARAEQLELPQLGALAQAASRQLSSHLQ